MSKPRKGYTPTSNPLRRKVGFLVKRCLHDSAKCAKCGLQRFLHEREGLVLSHDFVEPIA